MVFVRFKSVSWNVFWLYTCKFFGNLKPIFICVGPVHNLQVRSKSSIDRFLYSSNIWMHCSGKRKFFYAEIFCLDFSSFFCQLWRAAFFCNTNRWSISCWNSRGNSAVFTSDLFYRNKLSEPTPIFVLVSGKYWHTLCNH